MKMKKVGAFVVAIAIAMVSTISVSAATTKSESGQGNLETSIPITGMIVPTTVSVTHPITLAYQIDPTNNTFTCPSIAITNNTVASVNVNINSIKSTTGGSVTFTDVDPQSKSWDKLNASDSKKFISLGAFISNSNGWNEGYNTTTYYSSSSSPLNMGVLAPGSTGNIDFTAKFGRAIDTNCTSNVAVSFSFTLA
jgi:hypothetical protein